MGQTGGKDVGACCPEEIREAAAVGMAGDVNAFVINLVFLVQRFQDGIDEEQVTILLIAFVFLPTSPQTLGISQGSRGGQPLGRDKDCLRPILLKILAGIVLHSAAVAMKANDHRSGAGTFLGGQLDDGLAFDAIDSPVVGFCLLGKNEMRPNQKDGKND